MMHQAEVLSSSTYWGGGMSSIVNTNLNSLMAQNNLGTNQASLGTSMQRLSSGLRINSAKDDAAGLAISQRMTAQINGSNQAARNANDGISLAQTAEGALSQIGTNLQRMRELAVQSANGTNSASDRAALNNEVQALSSEIDRVAQSAAFNGVNLLDGSFNAQKFQVGANATANDSIAVKAIASARTSALGGAGSSFAATISGSPTATPLSAGDLTLNGFQVGASTVGAAAGQGAASAYSIAAAINAVSSNSGVTASAKVNTVTGATATVFTAIGVNTFSINGVNVGAVAAGGNAAGQGANVAAAINLVAQRSGVTATADAVSGALTLSTADGRDISIAINGTAADAATATANKATLLTQTGLTTGGVGSQGYAGAAAVAAVNQIAYLNGVPPSAGDWTMVNGVKFTFQQGAANVTVVNATNVTVTDNLAGMTVGNAAETSFYNAFLTAQSSGAAAAALSTVTASHPFSIVLTDVTPGISTTTMSTSSPGYEFLTNTTPGSAAGGTVAGAAVANHGSLTLSSSSASGIVWSGGHAAYVGLAASGTQAATTTATVASIASMDVLTAADATAAVAIIDGALGTVNASRASLGAIQNRFSSVVASLQTTSQNLTASVSRIKDADFAAETANLSRAQILQQAGTAMVAQANQQPQGVLALLR